jgi:thymidine kinase
MFSEKVVDKSSSYGWIEVITGSMFSGKTEELIRRLNRAIIAKKKVKIFKPEVDSRYDKNKVVSHDTNEINSTVVSSSFEIVKLSKGFNVVGIDEAQFFDEEIVHVCNELANSGIRVVVAGLDMDFKGNPFGPMPKLMAVAEYVTKVHAICSKTGHLANYSFRKKNNDSLVMLGESEEYEPLSRESFFKAIISDNARKINVIVEEVLPKKPLNR